MFASKDLFFTKPSGAYKISRSVRLRSSASAYFNRTPAGAGNRQVMTFSVVDETWLIYRQLLESSVHPTKQLTISQLILVAVGA
jgi:hypothetical protein